MEAITQWTRSLACQMHDDIDPADLSPSVSLTEVTRLFIKMEIELCYSHAQRQTISTQINSSDNTCTCTWVCTYKVCRLTKKIFSIMAITTSNNPGKPVVLFEHKCTYTNISSTSATLCCSVRETLQTDAEQINRGCRGKGTQAEGSKALS